MKICKFGFCVWPFVCYWHIYENIWYLLSIGMSSGLYQYVLLVILSWWICISINLYLLSYSGIMKFYFVYLCKCFIVNIQFFEIIFVNIYLFSLLFVWETIEFLLNLYSIYWHKVKQKICNHRGKFWKGIYLILW